MATSMQDMTQHVFIEGLRNARALEHQALALMDRQIDHLANYPEVLDRLQSHRRETEVQIERLDGLLNDFEAQNSALKEIAMSITGNLAAIAHVFAPDEILKNSFANYAFENFEIASYESLLTLADAGGFSQAATPLRETLAEEQAMADWVRQSLPMVTRRYVDLKSAGEVASH
jgi:ferritin-like metal-binding protein YciE